MAQVATPNRRRHSLEVEVPFKTLRRSQEHLSPGQHSAQCGYGPSAIPVADADTDIKDPTMNNTTPPTTEQAVSI
jgi:hypothetical protein